MQKPQNVVCGFCVFGIKFPVLFFYKSFNRYLVDKADYVIAVWNNKMSGTGKTIRYAIDKGKPVYYIDVHDFKMKAV